MKEMNAQEILAQRKAQGIIKEFKFESGMIIKVKMPSPKLVETHMREVLRKNKKEGKEGEGENNLEMGFDLQDYFMGLLNEGLQDGWTTEMFSPDEYSEIREKIMDFFGQTAKKGGSKEPIIPNGQTV
jgi:hypothetical protein